MTNIDTEPVVSENEKNHTEMDEVGREYREPADARESESGDGFQPPGIADYLPAMTVTEHIQPEQPRREASEGFRSSPESQPLDQFMAGYQRLTVPEIIRRATVMSVEELRDLKEHEKSHRRRKTLLTKLERLLRNPAQPRRESPGPHGS